MSARRGGLGKGLGALIPTGPRSENISPQVLPAPTEQSTSTAVLDRDDSAPPNAASEEAARATSVDQSNSETVPSDAQLTDSKPAETDPAETGKEPSLEATDAPTDHTSLEEVKAEAKSEVRPAPTKFESTNPAPVAAASIDPAEDQEKAAPTLSAVPGASFQEIPVDAITPNPHQPRQVFDEESLEELKTSIKEFGLLQPVVVREIQPDAFELVMGERRWRAAREIGLTVIPAIVRHTADDAMLRDALLENIHRTQLNPLEEAAAYQQLLQEFDTTHEELAGRIGRSRSQVTNTIRLLNLPLAVQRRVAAGVLTAGHARALLSLEDPEAQEEIAARIVAEGLSVRATEELVTIASREAPKSARAARPQKVTAPGLNELATRLSDAFDTRVKVELGRRKGKIVVEFASVDDLERIVSLIHPEAVPHRSK